VRRSATVTKVTDARTPGPPHGREGGSRPAAHAALPGRPRRRRRRRRLIGREGRIAEAGVAFLADRAPRLEDPRDGPPRVVARRRAPL